MWSLAEIWGLAGAVQGMGAMKNASQPVIFKTPKGLGPDSAGQSGDTQGLSGKTEELMEEGQAYEAEVEDAMENPPESESGPVRPRAVDEEDVPWEYQGRDNV